jgi:hypothetical protein
MVLTVPWIDQQVFAPPYHFIASNASVATRRASPKSFEVAEMKISGCAGSMTHFIIKRAPHRQPKVFG